MEVGKLTVSLRTSPGKGNSKLLRTQGKVPGVCYGVSLDGKIEPLSIVVDVKALRAALDPVRKTNTVIDLTIEGHNQKLHALVKDYQVDPVRRDIKHVDLLAIDPNKEVRADVPLEFVGKPAGTIEGGQLRIIMRFLEVKAKPSDIPVKLPVDVSMLGIGDVIHVSTIVLPTGVTAASGRDQAVVTCAAPEQDAVAETVVGADGTTPAAGATPAAAAPAAGAKDAKAPAAGAKAAPAAAGKAAAGKAAPAAKPKK